MINLKESNPAQHIGGILWIQGNMNGYSSASICGLMKISMFELGIQPDGKPSSKNTTYKQDNNAFGMSFPVKRPTKAKESRTLSDGNTSAVFASVWDSVADTFLWFKYHNIPDNIKKADNCDAIIDFAQSKSWIADMSNYKKLSTDEATKFINDGRNALLVRVAVFTSISIIVLGAFLKKSNRVKYRQYFNKLGIVGKTLLPKPATIRKRARKVATRTRARVRYARMRRAKK